MTATELRRIRHCEPCDGSGNDPHATGDESNSCADCDGQGFTVLAPAHRAADDCCLTRGNA